jgi:hypothetical protein
VSREFGPKRPALRDVPAPADADDTGESAAEATPDREAPDDPDDRKEAAADAEPDEKPAKGAKREKGDRLSPTMTAIRNEEERSLKDWLDGLGQVGAFKVQLRREQPKHVRANGRDIKTEGFLETYDHSIDEEFIQREHGGGTYAIRVTRRGPNGSFKYENGLHRTITIAGDPSLERLPSSTPQAAQAAPPAEGLGFVKETFGVLTKEIDRLHERSERSQPVVPKGIDPALQVVLEQMRRDADRRDKELAEVRAELTRAHNTKPAEDPIKDKILGSLIDGESGRIAALRLTHDSELRQIKDSAVEEQRRRDDRHDRDIASLRQGHEREIATMKAGYEREIAALRQTHEVTTATTTQSNNLQLKVLENDNKRMERELDTLRSDLKDLRGRKDKTIVETAKELEAVKDALGLDGGDKTNFDKLLEVVSSPAAAEFVGRIVGTGKEGPAPGAAQAAAAQAPTGPNRVLVQAQDGNKYWHITDGKGGARLVPAKKKPKVIPATVNPDGTVATPEIVLPEVDPNQVAMVVSYLERAFTAHQEPEVVAQSGRTAVPEEILTWIRTHDTEQASGVDLFMSKVAKLPGTSPLLSQAGKNWLRKVGKALVGD